MSVDHLQINVSDVMYDNTTWLYEMQFGSHNDIIDALEDFNIALESTTGLTKEGTLISSVDTSGVDNMQWEAQNPAYGGSKYISHSNATTLRTDVITQLAGITNMQAYRDVVVRSYRNDLTSSDNYIYGVADPHEGLEIFISNLLYKSSSYVEPADIDTLLAGINAALDTISGLEFSGIVVSTWHGTNDGIFVGVDDASYNGSKYLQLTNATTLRAAVINAIASVTDVDDTNSEVEVRIAKKDTLPSS